MCLPPMLHINDLTYPHRGARPLRQGHGGHPGRAQGRLRRPQRLGQDHAAAPDRRRAATRRRRHQRAARDAHRLGDAGGAGRTREPDRVRAGRRQGARARCWSRRRPRTIPAASPTSTSGSPTSARTRRPRGRRASWPASASTRRPSSGPARNTPAAGACAWRWPPCCSPSPICCCSTSPPTTSISRARCGSRTICATIPTPC